MNDTPVECQNREWTEPQRDPRPPVAGGWYPPLQSLAEVGYEKKALCIAQSLFYLLIQSIFAHLRKQSFHRLRQQGVGGEVGVILQQEGGASLRPLQ